MIQKVLSFVKQYHMIEQNEHILAGVSGGADSVCLLIILMRLREIYGCRVTVAHVEHGIRGIDSLKDAAFVESLCDKLGVACYVYHCDAASFSREQGMSLEEGARELRYRYFNQLKKQLSADKIAVAHNQNDSAETLLFHMVRGAGLKGMCGIVPVRDNIIRPLLCVGRDEIEAFLQAEQQEFCTDVTNLSTEYSRNKIRHQVLPVLNEINEKAVAHLYRSTEYMTEALALVEQLADDAGKECRTENLLKDRVLDQPILVQKTMAQELLYEYAERKKDISEVHVNQILELFRHQTGKKIMLPYGLYAVRGYDGVYIQKHQNAQQEEVMQKVELLPGTTWGYEESGWSISSRIFQKTEENREIPKKTYTKWFDYDKIKNTIWLRRRCWGDYLCIDSRGRTQLLKKYFINEKIPARDRDKVPVLADGSHIIWVIGYRISEAYKVTNNTTRILEVQVNGGSIHE